jgi:hypothetical protein
MCLHRKLLLEIEGPVLNFNLFVIQHVMRASNLPAHLCVKYACTQDETSYWMDLEPGFPASSLQADRAGALCFE